MRRIGVLVAVADDPEGQARIAAFLQGLQQLGWAEGRNLQIDTRWGAGDADRLPKYAAALVALAPGAILGAAGAAVPPILPAARWLLAARSCRRCCRRRAACRSYSRKRPIRSALASSIAWRGRAATSLVLPYSNTVLARNGSNCSKRSGRA